MVKKMDMLTVGLFLKPQGIRGEVKVMPYTDSPATFRSFRRIFAGGAEYRVLSVRTDGEFVYLALKGIPDRNAAETLRGKTVEILREEAPVPAEGSYYIADLIGSEVVTEEGEKLGTLKDVTPAATDVYTLDTGASEVLFAAAKGVVIAVHPEQKRIVVCKARYLEAAVL